MLIFQSTRASTVTMDDAIKILVEINNQIAVNNSISNNDAEIYDQTLNQLIPKIQINQSSHESIISLSQVNYSSYFH